MTVYKRPAPVLRKDAWETMGIRLRDEFIRQDVMRSCLSCLHWSGEGITVGQYGNRTGGQQGSNEQIPPEVCIKHHGRPPATVIVNGCTDYFDEMEVPF